MNPATIAIDFSEMLLVPHPHSLINTYAVNVSASGHIALNQKFYDKLITEIPSLALEFRIHSDRTLLTIRSSEQPNYKFPKGGRIKDPGLASWLNLRRPLEKQRSPRVSPLPPLLQGEVGSNEHTLL